MPLYDLFHPPLSDIHQWQSFHTQWSGVITGELNRRLPKRFRAAAPVSLGPFISADIAERESRPGGPEANGRGATVAAGGVAVAAESEVYAPPTADFSLPLTFPDEYLIEVRDTSRGLRVVAVIELVSPANKKEADERERFAAKCMSYLSKGIGLVVVDTVTERHRNLHNEFVTLANYDDKCLMPEGEWIYVTAYRPIHRNDEDFLDLWQWPLAVGAPLPVVPLALRDYGCVRLDLEATYAETCVQLRIPE